MSTIKHYDGTSWQVDAAGNARNIELSEAALLDPDTTTISVERGFLKLNNKISKLEHNIAWIYQNGAKGGSGGSGGGGSTDCSITIKNDQTDFYTSSSTVEIPMMINSGNSKKTFYVTATDSTGKTLVDNETHTSLSYFNLTIKNITTDTSVILQAHDSSDNYTSEVIIQIHWGALNLVKTSSPDTQYILGGNSSTLGVYNVLNKTGKTAELRLYNTQATDFTGIDPIKTWTITSSNSQQVYSINYSDYMELTLGNKYNFKLVLYSESLNISSSTISANINIVSGTTLALLIDGIGESEEYATEISQGSYVSFKVTPAYQPSDILEFDYSYAVYKGEDKISEYTEGTGLAKNVESIISFSTSNQELGTYKLILTVFKGTQTATVDVYFKIVESTSGDLRFFKGQLLASFGPFDFASSTTASSLTYTVPETGDYGFTSYPVSNGASTTLNLHNNTSSNGFTIDATDKIKYINLTGNTYATIDRFSEFFPDTSSLANSIFNTGFYIQCTYKYDSDDPMDQTILSLGTYRLGSLYSGFEINSDYITLQFGNSGSLLLDTPIKGENYGDSSNKTSTVTVGLKVWSAQTTTSNDTLTSYYFAIFIDGVMTKCTIIPASDLMGKWNFANSLYLGCRSDLTNQANCKIYDFEIYVGDICGLLPVYNWMAAVELAHLSKGLVNSTIDSSIRKKNLFSTGSNNCLLCDSNGDYLEPSIMYSFIKDHYTEYDLDYPIIYLTETDSTSNMYQYIKATWSANLTVNGTALTKIEWDVNVNIKTKYGDLAISSSNPDYSPKVSIQGTSSLSYNSKNLELKMGYSDSGEKRLLKINNWLPEYEYTLKADVVDSAHVNNVAIGSFINDNDNNDFYENAYPKYENDSSKLGSKVKKTSEGFPCLVFIKFGNEEAVAKAGESVTQFLGVYNFNLGRYAYNNLGILTLKEYTEDTSLPANQPQLIETYSYTKEGDSNYQADAYSLEVEDNFGDDELLFRQAHISLTEKMLSNRSPSYGDNDAFTKITSSLFTKLAQSFTGSPVNQRQLVDDKFTDVTDANGNVLTWSPDTTNFTYEGLDTYINMKNLYAYYVIAIVFGLVDSMCKNLVFRSWDGKRWNPSFYDMDTAFKMDNGGADSIKYDAHPNYYYNTEGTYTIAGNGTTEGVTWCPKSDSALDGWTFAYAGTHNNRLWEILNYLDNNGNDSTRTTTIGDTYWILRNGKLKDPDTFIDTYFAGYVNKTGAIMYNYDYQQKYVDYSRKWDAEKGFIADTSSKQTSFLYGTRISAVRTWFKKRIQFLDSVYLSSMPTLSSDVTNSFSDSWEARQKASSTITTVTLTGTLRCKIKYKVSSGDERSLWIDTTAKNYNIETQTLANSWYLWGSTLIKAWKNFNRMGWSATQTKFNFPYISDFSISGLTIENFTNATPLYDTKLGVGLKNVRTIDMSKLTMADSNLPSLDFSGCESLEELNLSGSNVKSFTLPTNGTLKVLDLSDSDISTIPVNSSNESVLTGLSGLTTLNLSGTKITNLELKNLPSLTTLTLPSTLESLDIENCNISNITITWSSTSKSSPLTTVKIDNCANLSTLDLQGLNNLSSLQITNCPNIVNLNFYSVLAKNINIHTTGGTGVSFKGLTKLQSLNIGNTTLFTDLDLEDAVDLNNLYCWQCTSLKTVKCAYNADNLIELQSNAFSNCTALTSLTGYFDIQGAQVFEDCTNLIFDANHDNGTFDMEFSTNSVYKCFKNCRQLGVWYKDLIHKFSPTCTNAEECFAGSGISGVFSVNTMSINGTDDMGLTNTNSMFADTAISGSITENLWEHLPDLLTCERMFENTLLNYIDNDFFKGCTTLTNVDYMFNGCVSLTAVADADLDTDTETPLHSKDFFIDLIMANSQHSATTTEGKTSVKNPSYLYPYGVFKRTGIKMTVDVDDDGRPYLFHLKKDYRTKTETEEGLILNNYLYDGIDLIYEPDTIIGTSTLFEPGTRGDYFVPYFAQINSPFTDCSITLNLSNLSGEYFLNNKYLKTLNAPFYGTTLTGTLTNFLNYDNSLTTINQLFNGATTKFDSDIFQFTTDFFAKCTSLTNISNIFSNCTIPMLLCSNMFENCSKLANVSNAFASSRVLGSIPEKLFYGTNINNMSGVFDSCWNLGYSTICDYYTAETDLQTVVWSDHYINAVSIDEEALPATKVENYSIPTDLFDYCTANADIAGVLGSFFYKTRYAVVDESSGSTILYDNIAWFGPTDLAITADFFKGENLVNSTKLQGVFKNTHFAPYKELDTTNGLMYPDYLFANMPNLTDIAEMFKNTEIYQGCYINKSVLYVDADTALPLVNIQGLWQYCTFHTDYTDSEGNVVTGMTEIDQVEDSMFEDFYPNLRNCSYIFAGNQTDGTGIPYISNTLLALTDNTSSNTSALNIDSMFAYAPLAKACEAPIFSKTSWTFTGTPGSYLTGINSQMISNADAIKATGIYPSNWDSEDL